MKSVDRRPVFSGHPAKNSRVLFLRFAFGSGNSLSDTRGQLLEAWLALSIETHTFLR